MRSSALVLMLLAAQAPARPAFEVVSVRPNPSATTAGQLSSFNGRQFVATNIPLRMIVLAAYDLRDVELVGLPDWTATARFDITATFPEGTYSLEQRRQMTQDMLADRFKLVTRREMQERPIYRLVLARADGRLGPRLTGTDVDCQQWFAEKKSQIIGTPPVGLGGARLACAMSVDRNYIQGHTRTMADLVRSLERAVGRVVVDGTGLTGTFDMELEWTPAAGVDPQARDTSPLADSGVSIFTAIQEQLGLRLEAGRAPVPVLLVTSIERPTPN